MHTDIVSHSTDGFPTRDGKQFLEFLRAVAASGAEVPSPKPVEQFLASHPAALAFVQTPKPFPSSLARESYYGVTAFAFTNGDGHTSFGRYRILPELGIALLTSWRPDDYDVIAQHDGSIDAISSGCRTHKKSNIENDDYAP